MQPNCCEEATTASFRDDGCRRGGSGEEPTLLLPLLLPLLLRLLLLLLILLLLLLLLPPLLLSIGLPKLSQFLMPPLLPLLLRLQIHLKPSQL